MIRYPLYTTQQNPPLTFSLLLGAGPFPTYTFVSAALSCRMPVQFVCTLQHPFLSLPLLVFFRLLIQTFRRRMFGEYTSCMPCSVVNELRCRRNRVCISMYEIAECVVTYAKDGRCVYIQVVGEKER